MTRLPQSARRRLLEVGEELVDQPAGGVDVGRYRILGELGRGGMGVVYEAHDPELDRRVALKVIAHAAGLGSEARQRFLREARAAARLAHPHIASVYEATPEAIAMQLVDGVTLDVYARRPETDARDLARLVRDAALAVHAAHEAGIVHRDLKPGNLMVEQRPDRGAHVFVLDFGLAKTEGLDASLSASGGLLGTPHYMAPEQARGQREEVDERADVHGLGATLFAALAGRPPFQGADPIEVLRATVEREAPDLLASAPSGRGVDRDLATIVAKCLAKEPERRYPSALALASDLDRWLRGEPVEARPASVFYRAQKLLSRQRTAVHVGLGAFALALVIAGPLYFAERARRHGAETAEDAMALASKVERILAGHADSRRRSDPSESYALLMDGIADCLALLGSADVAPVHYLHGRLLREVGRLEQALAAQEAALQRDPDYAPARFEHGLLLAIDCRDRSLFGDELALEDLRARATEELAAVLAAEDSIAIASPVDVDVAYGLVALLEGDLERAEASLREAVELDPVHVQAHLSLGALYTERGESFLAMRHSVRATDLMRGHVAPVVPATPGPVPLTNQPTRGTATPGGAGTVPRPRSYPRHLALPGVDALFFDFHGLLALAPSDAFSYAYRAQLDVRRAVEAEDAGEESLAAWDRALARLESAATLRPDDLALLVNRGLVHASRARLLARRGAHGPAEEERARALGDLDRAVALDPAEPTARLDRALVGRAGALAWFLAGNPERSAALAEQADADLTIARGAALEAEDEGLLRRIDAVRGE